MTQELTTQTQQLQLQLPESKSLVDVRMHPEIYPHYEKLPQVKQYGTLRAILLNCYKLRHDPDISYIETDAVELRKRILKNFDYRNLTTEEIGEALTKGATGGYGKCWKMTVEFCLECIQAFINENEAEYLEAKRRREKQENAAKVKEQTDLIRKKYAVMMANAERQRQQEQQQRNAILEQYTKDLLKHKNDGQ